MDTVSVELLKLTSLFLPLTDKCRQTVLVTDGLYWAMISANIGVIAVSLPSLSSSAKEGVVASILARSRSLCSRARHKLFRYSDKHEIPQQERKDVSASDQIKGPFRIGISNESKNLHNQSSLLRLPILNKIKIHEAV